MPPPAICGPLPAEVRGTVAPPHDAAYTRLPVEGLMSKRFVSVGEAMIEMSGGEDRLYRLGFAGDTFNTAWYARALLPQGWAVDFVSAVGDDVYSRQMRDYIASGGIGTNHLRTIADRRPGLYMIHQEHGDRHFTYWRGQSAARQLADDAAALKAALTGASIVYFSGITLAILLPRARGRLMRAIVAARDDGAQVVFDPNLRPALWTSQAIMASTLTAAATISDIVLPTFSDEAPVFGDTSPDATAERYLEIGVREVVVKNGAEAALAANGDGRWFVTPGKPARIVDPTAAGDSFNGAYLAAREAGAAPEAALVAAHRVAGIVIGHKGANIDPALVRA